MRRATLLVVGSLLVVGAAFWLFSREAARDRGIDARTAEGADAGGRREPSAHLAVPSDLAKPDPTIAAEDVKADVRAPASVHATSYRFEVESAADGTPVVGAFVDQASGESLGRTDAHGRLDVETTSIGRRLGGIPVRVHRDGFLPWRGSGQGNGDHRLADGGELTVTSIRLTPAAQIDGRVLLANGEPVPSASVLAACDFGAHVVNRDDRVVRASTDREGRFHFEGFPLHSEVLLVASAPGRKPFDRLFFVTGPEDDLVLTMPEGGVVEGVVSGADGRRRGGVVVWLQRAGRSLPDFERGVDADLAAGRPVESWGGDAWAVSNADGTYVISGVPLDESFRPLVRVSATHSGHADAVTFRADGERQTRDVRVPGPAWLAVTLVGLSAEQRVNADASAASDGEGIPLVKAEGPDGPTWKSPPVSPGFFRVRIDVPEHPPYWEDTDLVEGETRDLRVELPRSAVVSGVVVNDQDRPVAGAEINWSTKAGDLTSTVNDETGTFAFNVWPDAVGQLNVWSGIVRLLGSDDGPMLLPSTVENVKPGTTGMRIVLVSSPWLIGRFAGWDPRVTTARAFVGSADLRSGWSRELEVQSNGTFALDIMRVGEPLLVDLGAEGFAPSRIDVGALAAGETRDLGALRLVVGRELAVLVHDEAGRPVRGARVMLREQGGADDSAWTGADGIAHLPHVPPRAVAVAIEVVGRPLHAAVLPVVPSGEPQVITLGAGARIDGRVIDADGRPAGDVAVRVSLRCLQAKDAVQTAWIQFVRTDADGRFGLSLGAGSFRIEADDDSSAAADVDLRAGERKTVELRLK